MAGRVGSKGNIVIDREIRARLGVEAGWETIQILREGHVEIHFLPPAQPGSSAGVLRGTEPHPVLEDDECLKQAIYEALGEAARERYDRWERGAQ